MRRPSAVLIGFLLLVASMAGSAPPPALAQTEGTVGIRILDAPQNRADDPRARLYIVDHLSPGTTINRRLEVNNDTNAVREVQLYAASASIEEGQFRFGEGREANDLTSWTRVAPATLSLAPGEKGVTTVTIAVPGEASEGERYGVVWAEMRSADSASEGIAAVNRVGVRMYLSVGKGGEPKTDFEVSEVEGRRDEDGAPVVAAIVRNTGGRALDLNGELQLSNGPAGLSAGPFQATLGTTLGQGQSAPVLFVLDAAVPKGPWDADVKMRSGTAERHANATITFPDAAGDVTEGDLKESGSLLPLIVGGIVGVLLLGWFLYWFFFRRAKKPPVDDDDAAA